MDNNVRDCLMAAVAVLTPLIWGTAEGDAGCVVMLAALITVAGIIAGVIALAAVVDLAERVWSKLA